MMKAKEIIQSWGMILGGRKPLLSIEITKECPLRCPGCYAYDEAHLSGYLPDIARWVLTRTT